MFITDETMDEIGFEIAQYAAIDGIDYVERFVSLNDWENGDCVHEYGEWSEHFPMFGKRFAPYATFNCSECGLEFEVK